LHVLMLSVYTWGYLWPAYIRRSGVSVHAGSGRHNGSLYSHVYGLDYVASFSPAAKMISMRIMVSLATTYHWPPHQLDIKNAFHNSILDDEFYVE